MADKSTIIRMYALNKGVSEADFFNKVELQDNSDGKGVFIATWNLNISEPTDDDLKSHEAEADKFESNAKILATRRLAYGDIGDQLDEIYKDIDSWKARIKSIKDANPKS